MVHAAIGRADPPARQARHDLAPGDRKPDRLVDAHPPEGQGLVEHLRLIHVSRIPVQDPTGLRVGLADAFLEDLVHEVVGDKFAAVHVRLQAASQGRIRHSDLAEHVAGRDVGHAQVRGKPAGLRALPSSWWP